MMFPRWQRWFGSFALSLLACSPPKGAGALSPKAHEVRVETSEPPAGARLIGPVEGSEGPDCDPLEARGTEAGALAALRKAATERGIDFVQVITVSKPYSGHDCLHKRYRIEGMGYAVNAPPAAPACSPACGAGYACRAGTCEAQCDPACGPAQYCRFDRVCAPLPAAPAVTPAPVTPAPATPAPVTPAPATP